MKRIDLTGSVDEMTTEQLAVQLEESREELEYLYELTETLDLVRRFKALDELKQIHKFCKMLYETDYLNKWGFLFGASDNITQISANLADEQQADLLNRVAAAIIDTLENDTVDGQGKRFLEGIHITPTLKQYLDDRSNARKTGKGAEA